MNEIEKRHAAELIHETARQYRGRFLNSVACIEHDIANLLADYFCGLDEKRRAFLYEKILTRGSFSFNQKKDLLTDLVKRECPDYWAEHENVLSAFQSIQTFRNRLAHSRVDVSDEAMARPISDGIGFTDWNKGKPISSQEFEEFQVKANMIGNCILDIKRLIQFV